MFILKDTIAAVATPLGTAGLGIIRVSGDGALGTAQKILARPKPLERKRSFLSGALRDPRSGEVLDQGLVLVMPGPRSYTGEDVVEFHVHGNPSLLSALMEALLSQGLRPADPGEFTYRAFQHGRMDLSQAEAVEALVSAQGEASRRQALKQLTGGLSSHLEPLEEALKSLYLKIEARLEFSEDGIPALDQAKFSEELDSVKAELQKLLESYRQGKVLREGLTVALLGPPNAGKSSLLNRLLGMDRAIVSPLAGTTRDLVEGEVLWEGVKVRFFDTAGIREASNEVEEEGIRRSRKAMEEADLLFWVWDLTDGRGSFEALEKSRVPQDRTWYLFNKRDLAPSSEPWKDTPLPRDRCLALSCKTGDGIQGVYEILSGLLKTPAGSSDLILTSARHEREIGAAHGALGRLQALMVARQPYELWAEELKEAALAVGRVRGRNLPASAFEDIFTKFCIGK